jgi:hypothetical protein
MWTPPKRINPAKLNTWRGCGLSGARDRARTGDPHVGKEMLGLISLRFFAQSGHIDAFRSIVGEGGRETPVCPPVLRGSLGGRSTEVRLVTGFLRITNWATARKERVVAGILIPYLLDQTGAPVQKVL